GTAVPPGVTYVDYLLPRNFVQSVTFRASNTAVGHSEDLRRGVIDRFRSMPMARSAVLLGRTIADLVRNVLIIGLMIGVGYLVGFRFQAGVLPALGCVALVAAFGFALSWIFAFVSLVVRGAESAQTAGFVLVATSVSPELRRCCLYEALTIAHGTVWSLSPEMSSSGPRSERLLLTFASVRGLRFAVAAWNSGAPEAATWNVSCSSFASS